MTFLVNVPLALDCLIGAIGADVKTVFRHSAVQAPILGGLKTIHEWASAPSVHPHQVSEWQRQLLQGGRAIFRRGGAGHQREQQEQEGALYEPIGRLNMALEWLNKTAASFS